MPEIHPDWLEFYGNAALAFKLHGIQKLLPHFSLGNCLRQLQKPVGQGALAMIYVCDYYKVSDIHVIQKII